MSKHNPQKTDDGPRSKKIFDKIKEWALKDGIIEKEPPLPNNTIEHNLVLRFNPGPNQKPVTIIFPKGKDMLIISANITVSEEHKSIWLKTEAKQRKAFIENILKTGHWHNLEFMINFTPEVQRWGFSNKVYFDEFSKGCFMEKFSKIGNIINYSILLFQQMILEKNGTIVTPDYTNSTDNFYS